MSHTLANKLPRSGSTILLHTDCGWAEAGNTYLVTLYGRRTYDLERVVKGQPTGSRTQVSPWQLEASHFVTVEG